MLNSKSTEQSVKDLHLKDKDDIVSKSTMLDLISKLGIERSLEVEQWRKQRREEMKKGVLATTGSNDYFQGNLEVYFPEPVSVKLMEKFTDPEEKAKLSNMNMLWRDILSHERTTFLFHKTFPVLHKNSHMSQSEMLNCRVVCKEWKTSLDNYIQALPPDYTPNKDIETGNLKEISTCELPLPDLRLRLDNSIWVLGFAGVPSFPFFSRKLILQNDDATLLRMHRMGMENILPIEDYGNYWDNVNDPLLRTWGQELWQLSLVFEKEIRYDLLYKRIVSPLELTPNLKALQITYEPGEPHKSLFGLGGMMDTIARQSEAGGDMYDSFKRPMRQLPLPELPHLTTLFSFYIPPPIVLALMEKYRETLECVSIIGYDEAPYYLNVNENRATATFPRLKKLLLNCDGPRRKLSAFNAKLPSVKMMFIGQRNIHSVEDVHTLFWNLNNSGLTSLKKLNMAVNAEGQRSILKLTENDLKKLSLDLPSVEEFTLSVSNVNLKTIDFILPMKNLKQLELRYWKKKSPSAAGASSIEKSNGSNYIDKLTSPQPNAASVVDSKEIIKFFHFTNSLYESNIWKLFPYLKNVSITTIPTGALKSVDLDLSRQRRRELCQKIENVAGMYERIQKTKAYSREGYEAFWKERSATRMTTTMPSHNATTTANE